MSELEQAVSQCRGGNRSAYRAVVDALSSRAVRFAYHFLGNYLDAEDAAQEAFLQAWRRLETLRDEGSFTGWFFQILANTSRRKLKGTRTEESVDEYESMLEDRRYDPESLYQKKERHDAMKEALAKLPPHYRSAVILRDIEGLSYEQIAAVLQVPLGTVKSRISSAREKLRIALFETERGDRECRAMISRKN
ncbi:MAG: RNA polymerase sigma factor [Candidatus Eremiobacteraeota bacterium]|nr:RNA polymerase sigma factor [Candidatus Eremiobacteraeota bacterium]